MKEELVDKTITRMIWKPIKFQLGLIRAKTVHEQIFVKRLSNLVSNLNSTYIHCNFFVSDLAIPLLIQHGETSMLKH